MKVRGWKIRDPVFVGYYARERYILIMLKKPKPQAQRRKQIQVAFDLKCYTCI